MSALITRLVAVLLAALLAAIPARAERGYIGISMPTKSSARWIADEESMVRQFREAGFRTDLQYAEDDIPNQLAQIENMIVKGVDVLVIAAIDGTTLYSALENAHASGVRVVAYDRLIRGSPYVDYYATFDSFEVGVQQASSLIEGMKNRGDGPWNMQLDQNLPTFMQ